MLTSQQRETNPRFLFLTRETGQYSRVSSGVGSVSYGHVVMLVCRAPDPVESPVSPGEWRREPTLQHHVGAFYHVLHLLDLTIVSWNKKIIRKWTWQSEWGCLWFTAQLNVSPSSVSCEWVSRVVVSKQRSDIWCIGWTRPGLGRVLKVKWQDKFSACNAYLNKWNSGGKC